MHFTYHSQTQRVVHGMPFVLAMGTTAWLHSMTDDASDLAGTIGLVGFGWLLVSNILMNALVRHWGPKFGPIDLSRNISPTSTEKFFRGLNLAAAAAAGVAAAAMLMPHIVYGWAVKIPIASLVFVTVAGLAHGTLTLAVIVLSGFRIRPTRG